MHTFISIILLILVLGVIIFVHELGHFMVAKWFGIRVDEFGMGFPPRAVKLFSRNGTDYTLNWIPFGGFVKIYGEDQMDKTDPDYGRSLVSKAWWKQIFVLIAGVTMNVLLAWIIFTGMFMTGAPVIASQVDYPEKLRDVHLTVLQVAPGSPAEIAGIVAGDSIQKITTSEEVIVNPTIESFTEAVQGTSENNPVVITILRGAHEREISVVPTEGLVPDHRAIGVAIDLVGYQTGFSPLKAIGQGATATVRVVSETGKAFGQLITGHMGLKSLSGPVGLTKVVGDAGRVGVMSVLTLVAVISINLAIINILPFPALDGGRILFVIIEKIIRRPLPQKWVLWVNTIGFGLLILLMVVVTIKDVIGLI